MYVRESGALLLLPRPQSGDIPNGPMVWPLGDEVIFYPDDEPPLRYDLGQLRLFPLSTSEKFKPEDEWTKQAKLSFPSSDAWQFEAAEWIYQVTPSPRRNPQVAPKAEFDEVIALSRPGFPVRRTFPDLTLFPGITCVPALDASKCILTQKDKGEVFYFGIVKPQAAFYTLDLPEAQAIPDSKKTLAETLSGNTLCAVVYAPMVNPLTGRTIGPDREQPKGLLRFIGWESKTATFYVASAYDLFQPQDVVADIHEWKDGRFLLSTLQPDPFWWTALGQGGNEGKIPIGVKPLPLNWTLSPLSSGDRWFVFLDSSKGCAVQMM